LIRDFGFLLGPVLVFGRERVSGI